jgi:hypothetical protein
LIEDKSLRKKNAMINPKLPTNQQRLLSLLALSAGALAMPQEGEAGIVFTDLGPSGITVGFTSGVNSWVGALPGGVNLSLWKVTTTHNGVTAFQSVYLGKKTGTGLLVKQASIGAPPVKFVRTLNAGQNWGTIGGTAATFQRLGERRIISSVHTALGPGSPAGNFSHQYAAFRFGTPGSYYYGWAELSLSTAGSPSPLGPDATIWGYAYDDVAGNQIAMGAVPEPSQTAIVMGALALGAAGIRRWRSRKLAQTAS